MLYAAIDIHRHVFQAAVLDSETCEVVEERFSADRESLARWLARLPAKEMLPESWIPPEEIQRLRDRTRLRKTLAEDRRRWALRLHAFLAHEGWPCARQRLLTAEGLRWVAGLKLPDHARLRVDALVALIAALEVQLDTVDADVTGVGQSHIRVQPHGAQTRRCS